VSRAGVHHATPNLPDTGCDRCRRGLRSVTQSAQTLPLRICVFGPEIDEAWLRGVAGSLPARAFLALFGAAAVTPVGDAEVACHAQGDAVDPASVLRHAMAIYPGDDLILLRTGTVLPAFWCERLLRAIGEADVLVASALDNVDAARSPLPEGSRSAATPQAIDTMCYAHGRHQLIDWPTIGPLLSAWSGTRLNTVSLDRLRGDELPALFAPLRGVLLDHLYVAQPGRELQGPQHALSGADAVPPSPLGELREQVAAALATDSTNPHCASYPGLDGKPVILHVLHGWGGGSERFVRDLAAADAERHHLVLTARGNFPRRCYGEVLELRDGALTEPPLRRIVLSTPIRSTALRHRAYAGFLYGVTREFGVTAIMVSSLIGHSLDALRSGLPTQIVGHDFYPLWPLLHRDFGDASLKFDAEQLETDLARSGAGFEFAERDAEFWSVLRNAYVDAAIAAEAQLIAPSQSMRANLLRLEPRFAQLAQRVIAHGLAPWPQDAPLAPIPPRRERLRLVVPGRVRSGKGAELLRAALPALREYAEIFLLGAGAEGEQFFGQSDVHVVLNYRRDELPRLLGQIAPDAALLLPTVAETFSYALSELSSVGLPVIATRVGALAERITDGVDGWLVEPDAYAVAVAVARLATQRAEIDSARAAVRATPQRGLAEMAADYRAALPLPAQAPARYTLTQATGDRLVAIVRAGEIGAAQRAAAGLREENRAQQQELDRRGDWGMSLDRDLRRARQLIVQRDILIEERTTWAQTEIARLEGEFDERTQWAKSLDAQVEAMRASTSWRVTRPLRYVMRKLRGARVRLAFALQRLKSIARRTRGSVASRGTVGTLRRIGDEFRRGTPIVPTAPIAVPDSDFSPFAITTATAPRVSIVIPVHNKVDYSVACLRSIAAHAGPTPFEVVVVDDASSDASAERLAQVAGIRVLRNEQNLGFVGSCNAGAAAASGDFLLFLNNDTVVTAGWIEALVRCFEEEPHAGLVGAKLVYPDGRLQEAGGIVFDDGAGWNYGRFDDPADPRYNFRREADYCSGAAIMLWRELFVQFGGFDARYAPAYYEDTDLAFAIRAAGLKVFYEPAATVVHFEGITAGTDTASGMKRFQVVNHDKFVDKWKDALRAQPAPIHEAKFAPAAANHRARGRILIVDAYTPTPDQDSGSLRMVNLMHLLREAGYAIAFMPENLAHMGAYTRALQALGVEALYHPFVSSPVTWLREHGHTLDAVLLSRHYVATNYVGAVRLYAPQARLIFDTVDLHFLREERAAALDGNVEFARHAARTKVQELRLMRETDITVVVSAAEKRLLEAELPNARIEVLSNVHAIHGSRRPFAERRDLVFVGGFQHPPNIDAVCWFVGQVMPLLREKGPAPLLHVIGSKVPSEVLDLTADDVIVHGFVADIAPHMNDCRLSIAPLRYGAGVKGKVNMAMSYGLPVVATSIAVEGMHVRPGIDVMVADTAIEFAAAIERAYGDPLLWQTLSGNGLANVREHFSFDAARAALKLILPELKPDRQKGRGQ
jgi:GT2 family glycosyltransferase/glycosyltransferase involved in cell wall biosynthesis